LRAALYSCTERPAQRRGLLGAAAAAAAAAAAGKEEELVALEKRLQGQSQLQLQWKAGLAVQQQQS
jgi:hypothetical protein